MHQRYILEDSNGSLLLPFLVVAIVGLPIIYLAIFVFAPLLAHQIRGQVLQIVELFAIFLPLGVIGMWRWSVWLAKKGIAQTYKPIYSEKGPLNHHETLGIVTPVYNEDKNVFRNALTSWARNNPDEIIAVIDESDKECINEFIEFSRGRPWAKLIVTPRPGKRQALADGIMESKSTIVALVDSDTMWTSDVREKALAPFRFQEIAGVTVRYHPIERGSIWQKLTDIFWDLRNYDDIPAQIAMGQTLSCLTGRTSLYRKNVIMPFLNEFLNEVLFGVKKESGEDKCLTRMVQRNGWKTYYQMNAVVYSSAPTDFKTFLSQRLRWTRNSHNSDLNSLWFDKIWKHSEYLAFCMIDRLISMFTLIIGPIFLALAVYMNNWPAALSIICLWIVGRGVKLVPHLRRHPRDLLILPAYIGFNFLTSIIRLYALVTLTDQRWIRKRVNVVEKRKRSLVQAAKSYLLTSEILCCFVLIVVLAVK